MSTSRSDGQLNSGLEYTGVLPRRAAVKRLLKSAASRIEEAITRRQLAERHNAYTDYCLMLLFCSTAHRPIIDPFNSLTHFDLEGGFVLISDKVIKESRAWRLVGLPEVAAKQVRRYVEYLPRLASVVSECPQSKETAMDIMGLPQGTSSNTPLFFYLSEDGSNQIKSVSPKEMKARWERAWPFPVNFLRHLSAQWLLDAGVNVEHIQAQLGHLDGVDHPFGITAASAAFEVLKNIGNSLNKILIEMGWQEVSPPMRMSRSGPVSLKRRSKSKRKLGQTRRLENREKRSSQASKIVGDVLRQSLQARGLSNMTDEDIDRMLKEVIAEGEKSAVSPNHCIRLVCRYLGRIREGQRVLERIGRYRVLELEPSPFNANTLELYREVNSLRCRFIEYLGEAGKKGKRVGATERLAEIVVSSALFGGIAAEGRLEGISESIFKRSYRLGDEHFIDIALPVGNREGVFRWFPDPVSSRLILGWYESHHESSETSKHEVRRAIRDALAFLGVRVTRPYSTLAKLSMQAGKIELPGSVAAVFRGEIPAVSYPLAQYVRLQLELPLIGKDGALSRADKDDLKESERVWLPVIENNAVGKGGFERLAGRCLKGWIKEIKNAPFSGNERRDRKCKRLLAAKIKAELEVESGWSSLGLALAGWAVYLCESGTRWKKNLAFSTIEKYIQMVARVLEEVTGEKDFLYLSELEYEDSYLRALHYVQKRRRAALAGRLYEFHRFLGDQYAVEEPSWSAIMATAGLTQVTEYPSANALAENEYERIITHIIEDSALTERVRTQYAWLLLLCYRFGLRFGEALRVGRNHVQCSDDCERLTILVVSSMYGQTKTHAGERVVTQHEVLLDSEKKIVGAVMRLAASRLAEETPVLMAGEYGQYRKPISRSRAASYLSHCLKWSTGDHNLTLHHLRHGWVGRRVCDIWPALSAGSEGLETSVQADRLLDWRDAYPLKTLSVKVGHEQETTALGSYCHVLDKVGASFMNRLAPSLRASEEAYCLQLPLSTIRRRYERRKGEEQGLLKENARVAKRIPMPPIQVARVATAIPVYKSVKTSDRKPLTLVEIDGLLKRASNCGLSSERLARMLVLPEHRVERAIKKALELVRLTGFDRYQLHRHVKELIGKDVHRYVESGQQLYRLESRRFTEALNQAQKHVIEPGSGESAHYVRYLDIWARTYTPKTGGNLITDFEELDAIGQLMISLFHKPRFILRGEEALLKSEKIVAWSERNGARIQKNKKQKAIEKVRHRAVNCIELRSEECIPYTQTRELARYLFILSIY